jgi:hypothetical protein
MLFFAFFARHGFCRSRCMGVKCNRSRIHCAKKMKMSTPSAVILKGLRKLAAYHCQVQIYTTYNKVTDKLKFGFIKELFFGNPGKNIKGACEQVIDSDHAFSCLYHKHEGEDGMELTLKPSCCGVDTTANYVAGVHFTALHIYTYATAKHFSGRSIWMMADSVLSLIKKLLSLVPKLSPKIVNIDSGLKVIGYATGPNEASFLQAIDNGMYEMERREGCGLNPDDDSVMIPNLDEDEDESKNEVANEVVVVEETPLLDTSCNPFNGVTVPLGYAYTGKSAFICFGPSSNYFSPSLKPGGASGMDKEERKNGGRASIRKMQQERTTINRAVCIDRGISQQNRVTFGLMAQNEDNADQAHRDMRLAMIMKCIDTTKKMIDWKMTMWERMVDVTTKDSLFVSISSLMDKVEDLNSQSAEGNG